MSDLNLLIVHAVPLIRTGIAALVADKENYSKTAIFSFSNLDEANTKFEDSDDAFVAIIDLLSWSSLCKHENKHNFKGIRTLCIAYGVIATKTQLKISNLSLDGLSELITIDAELSAVDQMIDRLASGSKPALKEGAQQKSDDFSLTSQQAKILELMAQGFTDKEIATELQISKGTVKSHNGIIFTKLDCHKRTDAARIFLEASHIQKAIPIPR